MLSFWSGWGRGYRPLENLVIHRDRSSEFIHRGELIFLLCVFALSFHRMDRRIGWSNECFHVLSIVYSIASTKQYMFVFASTHFNVVKYYALQSVVPGLFKLNAKGVFSIFQNVIFSIPTSWALLHPCSWIPRWILRILYLTAMPNFGTCLTSWRLFVRVTVLLSTWRRAQNKNCV